jgi:hypothetical protein
VADSPQLLVVLPSRWSSYDTKIRHKRNPVIAKTTRQLNEFPSATKRPRLTRARQLKRCRPPDFHPHTPTTFIEKMKRKEKKKDPSSVFFSLSRLLHIFRMRSGSTLQTTTDNFRHLAICARLQLFPLRVMMGQENFRSRSAHISRMCSVLTRLPCDIRL